MENNEKKHMKRDLILVAAVLVIAAIGFLINQYRHREPALYLEINVEGTTVNTFKLNKDLDFVVHGADGGTNHLIIEDGNAWIEDATCPDKICIHQGKIYRTGEMIVCLPNQMIASIVSEDSMK